MDEFFIAMAKGFMSIKREPTTDRWYLGIHQTGCHGVVAKWNGYHFTNSVTENCSPVMSQYIYLVELPEAS